MWNYAERETYQCGKILVKEFLKCFQSYVPTGKFVCWDETTLKSEQDVCSITHVWQYNGT
jgi:hypothetical protein